MPNPAPWQSIPGQKHLVPVKRPRKPVRRMSAARRKMLAEDARLLAEWWKTHKYCEVCRLRKQRAKPATERHHARGRAGSRMLDTATWIGTCAPCHRYIHANPKWAREHGLLEFRY